MVLKSDFYAALFIALSATFLAPIIAQSYEGKRPVAGDMLGIGTIAAGLALLTFGISKILAMVI